MTCATSCSPSAVGDAGRLGAVEHQMSGLDAHHNAGPRWMRTLGAKSTVCHLRRPRPLVIRAWLWLAAKADNLEEKRRCLHAVLQLHPENEPATLALLVLDQKRPTS